MMSEKIQEARGHIAQAEKHLKATLLRWKSDYDSAADEYSLAAQCYRVANDRKNAKDCYVRCGEMFKKARGFFHAAKALEQAMLVGKEFTTVEDMFMLASDASSLYQQHGSGDAAANVLDKTAKIIEERAPDLAVKLYQQAADISSCESSQHQGAEYIGKSSRLLVRMRQYDQAVDSIRREIGFWQEANNCGAIGRLVVAIVLVQLARGDPVAAEKAYKEWGNNCEAPEMSTIEQLLQAYDEEDGEAATRALRSPFIRSMDVDYARLAGTIPLPKGMEVAPRPAPAPAEPQVGAGSSGCGSIAAAVRNAEPVERAGGIGYSDFQPDDDGEEERDQCDAPLSEAASVARDDSDEGNGLC